MNADAAEHPPVTIVPPASDQPLVSAQHLFVRFAIRSPSGRQFIRPVDDVSFSIDEGEVLALVGESGSGKTTIARSLVGVVRPHAGVIRLAGQDVTHLRGRRLAEYRTQVQMVFQDPFGSLNPVKTVASHLLFPLRQRGLSGHTTSEQAVDALLEQVGLTPAADIREKFPHELSGGQRQRVAIARALSVKPRLLVADEPVSMLDVSIRAGILKLLNDLKRDFRLSYLYVTHDLASARYFGDRIMVLYGGRVMETAPAAELIKRPQHPYAQLLLAATPSSRHSGPLPERLNAPPNLLENRRGCPFAPRCLRATQECHDADPPMEMVGKDHSVACFHL